MSNEIDVESDSDDNDDNKSIVSVTMGGKKGGIALQTEVHSQAEWDVLTSRKGLGVVDVYSKWCGPCKAITSLFRKIRNEQSDDFLFFAMATTNNIESLAAYRGKSRPTFLFFAGGQLVNVLRGCDGPMITKMINTTIAKERKIAEGILEREAFIDKVVSKEPEPDEKEELVKENVNEAEEELAKDMTCRKSGGSHLKFESVSKQVSILVLKPDTVEGGHVDQIIEEIGSGGYDVLQRSELSLTKEQVSELYKQDDNADNFEQLIEFMTSGPCMVLAVTKTGDVIGDEIITDLSTLCGPCDINTAKEEAPESLRAKFGTDSLRNAVGSSLSPEDAARELNLFFPDLEIPLVKHLVQQKSLQRTVALIRPNAFAQKDVIIKTILDNGFLIAIQKEIIFTKENAEEFYSQCKDEESFEGLISNMASGPSTALCLVKNNAIQAWKDMLVPIEVESEGEGKESEKEGDIDTSEQPISLQIKFAAPEDSCPPLHASESIDAFEKEMKQLFPTENTVVVIQPDTNKNDDEREIILSSIKKAGFDIVVQKEVSMTTEQAQCLYKDYAESSFFEELVQYMSSPSQFLVLAREDAIDGLQCLLGPAQPMKAKESAPDSLRGQFGKDDVRHAIYGSTTKDGVVELIKEFCSDIVFDDNGLVSEPVPGVAENINANEETAEAVVEGDSTKEIQDSVEVSDADDTNSGALAVDTGGTTAEALASDVLTAETDPTAEHPTTGDTTDNSSVPTCRELTTDGPTETSSTGVSREGTTTEGETTTDTDADTA